MVNELRRISDSIPNLAKDVLVFCDPGTDDIVMQAEVNALAQNILGYIPCAGNTSLHHTVNNALLFTEITERRDVRVYPGSERPSQASATSIDESGVHVFGAEGLGNLKLPSPTICAEKQNGVEFAVNAIKSAKKPITLISTGGMTDVCKVLMQLGDQALSSIAAISIMGGVLDQRQANAPLSALQQGIPRWAEFNVIYDPNSASQVFKIAEKAKVPIFFSTLDLTHTLTYTKKEVHSLRNRVDNYVAKIMADLMGDVPLPYLKRFGEQNPQQPAHDLNASMCLFHPELYQYQRGFITVDEEDSVTRGKTTFSPCEEGNVFVLHVPEERRPDFFLRYEEDLMNYNSPLHRIRGYLYDIRSRNDIANGVALISKVLEETAPTKELDLSGLLITPIIADALIELLKATPNFPKIKMSLPPDLSGELAEKIKVLTKVHDEGDAYLEFMNNTRLQEQGALGL